LQIETAGGRTPRLLDLQKLMNAAAKEIAGSELPMNRESSQQFRHKQYGWVYKISYVHKT
jgi:hypothetical protein